MPTLSPKSHPVFLLWQPYLRQNRKNTKFPGIFRNVLSFVAAGDFIFIIIQSTVSQELIIVSYCFY